MVTRKLDVFFFNLTLKDLAGEEGGVVDLGHGSAAWVEEGSMEDSTTVRHAWHKWPFVGMVRGSSVLLRSLSLPPMDWTMSG